MINKCQAKNPTYCPYHGSLEQKQIIETIGIYEAKLYNALTISEYSPLKRKISNLNAQLDATGKGYKKLSKDLKKALRNGTIDEKTSLAKRYEQATVERSREGLQPEWTKEDADFAQQVIEGGENNDVVYIPSSRAKTRSMSILYHKLQAKGYTVTKLEMHPIGADFRTPEDLDNLGKETTTWLENNGHHDASQLAIERRIVFSGLTFINLKGKKIKVQGSYEVN